MRERFDGDEGAEKSIAILKVRDYGQWISLRGIYSVASSRQVLRWARQAFGEVLARIVA